MPKKPRADNTKRRLSSDEASLWSRVAQTAKPLSQPPAPIEHEDGGPEDGEAGDKRARAAPPAMDAPVVAERVPPAPLSPPRLDQLDRRELRKIASRRTDVDARIDLHGMRQSEAHLALLSFLRRAQIEGHRYVLVITGKGGAKGRAPPDRAFGEEEKGVLKRAVPHWLGEPEFRTLVVGYGPANARHGGAGALYVRLRRER